MKTWTFAGINFDHMHMGDNLRMVFEHPHARIVGLCDERPERTRAAADKFAVPDDLVFADYRECLARTRPDVVLLCPATARHAEWVEKVAPFGVHVIIEKPFAASLADADAMVRAMDESGKLLAINWPLVWVAAHVTAKRLIDEGVIGRVQEVHYYDGNRGPLWHTADKVATDPAAIAGQKRESWFYKREHGGGSLLDYLGYGVTLGTWFLDGRIPLEVTSVAFAPPGLEVDEQSVTTVRYDAGLATFQTRWGTFTDPWVHQPQPKCGFVVSGTAGTISSYDYEPNVRVQTAERPEGFLVAVDCLEPPHENPVQYVIHCLETGAPLTGPLSPETSRIGQRIVDSAVLSAREKRTVSLVS